MNPRRAAVLGTAIAAGVTVAAAVLSEIEVALAASGVAMLGILTYLVLSMRWLAASAADAARNGERPRRAAAAGRERDDKLRQQMAAIDKRVGQVATRLEDSRRDLRELARGQADVRNTVHRAPGLTAEMIRVYERLVAHTHPMPELGGWAASPSTMLWIIDHVETVPVRTVVECGSGTSTVWIATALERRGGEGRVVALESSEHYAQLTRIELERLGVAHRATVLHAPLVDTPLPGRTSQPWFDVSALELDAPIDLLFVDGPPGGTAPEARYPAFPVLADRLAADATVILDDTGRPEEDRIVELWTQEVHAGRNLTVGKVVDRSTVLRAGEV